MPAGRPPAFETAAEMQVEIDAYFNDCVTRGKPPTIAGISYFLGFDDRDSFSAYGAKDEFSRTVKGARLRIEQDRSEKLLGKDTFTPGLIFDLKNNHGWKDKTALVGGDEDDAPIQAAITVRFISAAKSE